MTTDKLRDNLAQCAKVVQQFENGIITLAQMRDKMRDHYGIQLAPGVLESIEADETSPTK